jgi:hypothetical protein
MRIGRAGGKVQRAGTERGKTDAGLAGQPAMRGGHEGRRLLMARQHQLDLRLPQRLDQIEVFLAGNAEDALDTLILQRCDEDIRSLGHGKTCDVLRLGELDHAGQGKGIASDASISANHNSLDRLWRRHVRGSDPQPFISLRCIAGRSEAQVGVRSTASESRGRRQVRI